MSETWFFAYFWDTEYAEKVTEHTELENKAISVSSVKSSVSSVSKKRYDPVFAERQTQKSRWQSAKAAMSDH